MKLKRFLTTGLILILTVFNIAFSQELNSGIHFTTDVEAIDLDHDGDKDLVFSSYRHPYFEGEIWESFTWAEENCVYYMENNSDYPTVDFEEPDQLIIGSSQIGGFDCIDFGYVDGSLYLVAGLVNLKYINGGIRLYKQSSNPLDPFSFEEAGAALPTNIESFSLQEGDWHCVQFVDVNNDGYLDIAGLLVNGPMVILFYNPNLAQFSGNIYYPNYLYSFANQQSYDAKGTTMAWGDIDGDSDLDVYINNNKYVIVYINYFTPNELPENYFCFLGDDSYILSNNYNIPETSPDRERCKSALSSGFGWYFPSTNTRKLALALGSSVINTSVEQYEQSLTPEVGIGSTSGISVYSLTSGTTPDLEFIWAENYNEVPHWEQYFDHDFQICSDLQWANMSINSNCQDIISAGYGILKRPETIYNRSATSVSFERERGAVMKFSQTGGIGFDNGDEFASTGDFYAASSFSFFDLTRTTSYMGDYIDWYADTDLYLGNGDHPTDSNDRILYLPQFPVDTLYVQYDEGVGGIRTWTDMPSEYYCYDLENGWISFSEDAYQLLTPFDLADLKVVVKISEHRDLHLGTCGIGAIGDPDQYGSADQLFANISTTPHGVSDDDELALNYIMPLPNEDLYKHEYATTEQSFELDPQGALGVQVGAFSVAEDMIEFYPDMDPWNVSVHWNECEAPFQGHFFWAERDKIFKYAVDNQKRTTIFGYGTPEWCKGNFQYIQPTTQFVDWHDRTCDERLHGLFLKNVITRYSKNIGYFPQLMSLNADYMPGEICIENEPDCVNTGYGTPFLLAEFEDAIFAVAMKLLYNYQAIKIADEDFIVIGPNFYSPEYNGITTRSPKYFDYIISNPDDQRIVYPIDYGDEIRSIYSNKAVGFSGNDEFQALMKFTDWWDYQYHAGTDPIFIEVQTGYDKGPLAWQECWKRMYEEQDLYNLQLQYPVQYPNRRVVSMESSGTAEQNASLTGSFFMKFPEDENLESAYKYYFVNIGTEANPNYVNVNYRRSIIDAYPGYAANMSMQNTLAKLLKNTQALPIYLEPGTYRTTGNTVQTPYQTDESIFLYEGQTQQGTTNEGPTVVQFGYRKYIPTDPSVDYINRYVRVFDGTNPEDITSLIYEAEENPSIGSVYLYNEQNSFFERGGAFVNTSYNSQTGLWETTVDFAPGEISNYGLVITPDENQYSGGNTNYDQQVYFSYSGEGWNLLSFNIKPQNVTWPNPLIPEFTCNSLFNDWVISDELEAILPIKGWNFKYPSPNSDLLWNMEQGYMVQMNADKSIICTDNSYFQPSGAGILLPDQFDPFEPGITGWPVYPFNTSYHWYLAGYYSNYSFDCRDAFWDMLDPGDNPNLLRIEDGDGNYIYNDNGNWHGKIFVTQPGKGYRWIFNTPYVEERYQDDAYFSYPDDPLLNIVQPPAGKGNNSSVNSVQQQHFSFLHHTPSIFPIVVDTIAIEGVEIEAGDQVGIFTQAGLCVGAEFYEGEFPLYMTSWADDPNTEAIEGFQNGEPISFKFWDSSEGVEIEFTPAYTIQATDDPDYPTHSGFGVGIVAKRTLQAGNPANIIPQNYSLGQNYPNPFNPTTTIPFALPTESRVKMEIYNILGQRVAVLSDDIYQAGNHKLIWDGKSLSGCELASGVYLLKMEAKGTVMNKSFDGMKKLLLIK